MSSHSHDIEGVKTLTHDQETYVLHNGQLDRNLTIRSTPQPFLPVYKGSKIANPSPLAFSALAVSIYIVAVIALGADGLTNLGVVPSVALGYSSIALLVAGIWEFPSGQPFGAALYITLSGFWFSLTLILSSWSGVAASYGTNTTQYSHAVGQFFFVFFITLVIFTIAANRSSGGLLIFLTLADFFFLFLALAFTLPTHPKLLTAAGSFGIIAAFVAWYATLASLLTKESSLFGLPVLGDFGHTFDTKE